MKAFFTFLLFILTSLNTFSQKDSVKAFQFSGYADLYYSYIFSNQESSEKPDFVYNHKRCNEVNTNLFYVKCNYNNSFVRANLAIMAGNYARYNLAAEPKPLQNIFEANFGCKLSKQNNLWLDVGIFPSHIGFESAVSADCWNLTRSILAENSPYFETGAKLTSTNKKETFSWSILLLNGWQKIQTPNYIQTPSFGMQFTYKPNDKISYNYSNFLGTDKPDSLHSFRTYHNLYLQYQSSKKIGYIIGFDLGSDKYDLNNYGVWFSPIAIVKYAINNKNSLAIREEYYCDKKETFIKTSTSKGFNVFGSSINYDYKIADNILWRFEGKILLADETIFNNSKSSFSATTSLSIKL